MAVTEILVASEGVADPGVSLLEGLRTLRRQGLHCDLAIVTSDGSQLLAHRAVLAAASQVLRQHLAEKEGADISIDATPEAARLLVDFVYEVPADDREPTALATREVLVLANQFDLPGLTQRAAEWLAKGVTTANAVEKLRACREFGLEALHARIVEGLLADRTALAQVSRSAQIAVYPEVMRALLQAAMHSTQSTGPLLDVAESPQQVDAGLDTSKAAEAAKQPIAEDAADVAEQPVADASPEGPAPKKRHRKGRGKGAA